MRECRHFYLVPILIIAIYAIILYASALITNKLLHTIPRPPILLALPLAVAIIIPSMATIKDTIRILGGPQRYFCSGLRMVKSRLSRSREGCGPPEKIIVEGPFSYARHPVYSSTLAITIAVSIIQPATLPAILLVALWVLAASIMEEKELEKSEEYRKYRMRVPRFSILGVIRYGYRVLLSRESR